MSGNSAANRAATSARLKRLWAEDRDWREKNTKSVGRAQSDRWHQHRLGVVKEFVDEWASAARRNRGLTREQAIEELKQMLGEVE